MVWVPKPQIGSLQTASGDAIGSEPYPREQEIILQACFGPRAESNAGPESAASWFHLHGLSIGIEFADQAISVCPCARREVRNKRLNRLASGVFEGRCAAEVGRVRLDQRGIEVVLAD